MLRGKSILCTLYSDCDLHILHVVVCPPSAHTSGRLGGPEKGSWSRPGVDRRALGAPLLAAQSYVFFNSGCDRAISYF